MASAWGSSWGAYWGNSWGNIVVPTPDVLDSGGGGGRKRKRKKYGSNDSRFIYRQRLNPNDDPIVDARIERSIEIAREISAENDANKLAEISEEQRQRIIYALDINLQNALAINIGIAAIIGEARLREIEEEEIIILLLAGGI